MISYLGVIPEKEPEIIPYELEAGNSDERKIGYLALRLPGLIPAEVFF